MFHRLASVLLFAAPILGIAQGPYAPSASDPGTTAISKDSSAIAAWATGCEIFRGYQNIADTSFGLASYGIANDAVGASDPNVVSLGDSGVAILTFASPITNIDGFDFAVFENSFGDQFLEFAHVEVSSNGVDYYRFPSISLTDTSVQTNSFGVTNPTNIYNLAGKYRGQFGTPFDLQELDSMSGLNINAITHVKLIDVIGSVDSLYATKDSQGNLINDPWPTEFESSGFDLDAVAVLQEVNYINELNSSELSVFPNPTSGVINILSKEQIKSLTVYNSVGIKVRDFKNQDLSKIDLRAFPNGNYWVEVTTNKNTSIIPFVKL